MKRRRLLLIVLGGLFLSAGFWIYLSRVDRTESEAVLTPLGVTFEKPLDKYAIDLLITRKFQGGPITLGSPVSTSSAFSTYPFTYTTAGKTVSGIANIPISERSERFPVIVQFRGYADRETYTSGLGTIRSGERYAAAGFITLSPDFLGYGGSDLPEQNIFEERFETYTTALDLLGSVNTLPMADPNRIGIWGHSNGGHIALTVLEITGGSFPTSLWAPVTKPFPYSILYYTDELPDKGRFLRQELARFEANYDVDRYSLDGYLSRIRSPIQLHQGTADEAVPVRWSREFVTALGKIQPDLEYFEYPNADHNLTPGWDTVVERDIRFFRQHLKS